MSAEIEREIAQVLSTETSAIAVSDKLFAVDGLFHRLAANKEERKVLVKSPLFRRAQRRFRELQYQEAAEFARSVTGKQAEGFVMKAERAVPA